MPCNAIQTLLNAKYGNVSVLLNVPNENVAPMLDYAAIEKNLKRQNMKSEEWFLINHTPNDSHYFTEMRK